MKSMRTWARRSFMISVYALLFAVLTVLAPLLALVAVVHGLLRGNRQATLRIACAVWLFFLAELAGVMGAALIWLRSWFRRADRRERFLADNYRLQQWWAGFLLRGLFGLLDLRLEVEGDDHAHPGPLVVLINHASVIDTLLPVDLVCRRHGMRLRYVLKKELLIDPCLDIVGNRLPNYFVDRAGVTESEVVGIVAMASDLGPCDGVLIYPEGTRFSPGKRMRALASLAERNPELHERAARLEHVLPPRPAGTLALLDAARRASNIDIVVCAHAGMEGFASAREMLSGALIGKTVRVTFWRVPAAEIPATRDDQIAWLYEQWARIDRLAS